MASHSARHKNCSRTERRALPWASLPQSPGDLCGPIALWTKEEGDQLVLRRPRVASSDATVTLRLEGQVRGPWVEELCRVCDQVLATGCALSLDGTEVSCLDRQGVALCSRLRARQVAVLHDSPFVAEQWPGEGV